MATRVLLTGASGYLGGSLLAAIPTANLPAYDTLYALVRTDEQAKAVPKYGAEPIVFDPFDEEAVGQAVLDNDINVVFYLIDAFKSTGQVNFIKALGELKKTKGREVHFLHTTGAKIFSSHAGAPIDAPLYDNDPNLFNIHQAQKPPIPTMQTPISTNTTITTLSLSLNVHSYIFAPCIVWGPGRGFANTISIQTVAIVRAAMACGRVYSPDDFSLTESGGADDAPSWPVCHIDDNTSLYLALLRGILESDADDNKAPPSSGKEGIYLASCGSVKWIDLYRAMARRLKENSVVDTQEVLRADEKALESMARGLGCEVGAVGVQLGGRCKLVARRGERELGWRVRFGTGDLLVGAGEEVDLILGVLGLRNGVGGG